MPVRTSDQFARDKTIGYFSTKGEEVVKQLQTALAEQRRRRKQGTQPASQIPSPAVNDLLGQSRFGQAYGA